MKDKFEQLIEQSKQIGLTQAEKVALRSELVTLAERGMYAGWFAHMRLVPVVGLVLLLGSGVTMAAEGAVPGDLLYSVKTSFNEPLLGAFALTSESRAAWETELTARRIHEAKQLADKGELKEAAKVEINVRLGNHVKQAETSIADLEVKGKNEEAVTATAHLRSTLESDVRTSAALGITLPINAATSAASAVPDTARNAGKESAAELRSEADVDIEIKKELDALEAVGGEVPLD